MAEQSGGNANIEVKLFRECDQFQISIQPNLNQVTIPFPTIVHHSRESPGLPDCSLSNLEIEQQIFLL